MFLNDSGILFALATLVSWSICIFPFTVASRLLGSNALNHFRLLLATLLLTLVSLVSGFHAFARLFSLAYLDAWIWLGFSGIVGLAMGDYFAFRMYAILGARRGSILTTFAPAAAFISGYFLLDEQVNIIGMLGMVVTITGVIGIGLGRKERMTIPDSVHGPISSGILFGILSAVCQGAGLVLAKKGFLLQESGGEVLSPIHATFIRMLISVCLLMLITISRFQVKQVVMPLLENRNSGIRHAVAGTIFGPFLGVCLSLITITKLDVAIAQTIFSLVPAGALLISFVVYREKISLPSLSGMILSIGGVFMLIWRNELASIIRIKFS